MKNQILKLKYNPLHNSDIYYLFYFILFFFDIKFQV